MLDAFLKVIDKAMELARIRDKRAKARYDEIFKTAFADLQTVHTNYMQLFHAVRRGLATLPGGATADDPRSVDILAALEEGRVACWAIRRNLVQLGAYDKWPEETIKAFRPSEVHFIQSLRSYFESVEKSVGETTLESVNLHHAVQTALLRRDRNLSVSVAELRASSKTIPHLIKHCDKLIAELDRRWSSAANAFVQLRFDIAGRTS